MRITLLLALLSTVACTKSVTTSSAAKETAADVSSGSAPIKTDITPNVGDDTVDAGAATGGGPIANATMGLSFQPTDLATDLPATPLRLWIDNSGNPIPDETLADLKAALQLHTVSGQAIDFTVTSYSPTLTGLTPSCDKPCDAGVNSPNQPEKGYLEINAKLTPSTWYELGLTKVPKVCSLASPSLFADAGKLKWGAAGVRFNPSSAPVLVEMGICTKGEGVVNVQITLSEPVEPKIAGQIGVGFGPVSCSYVPGTGAARVLSYTCASTSPIAGTWSIQLSPSVVALSGKPVGLGPEMAGEIATIDFSKVPDASGCRYYRW